MPTGILNCIVITQVDISMFITFGSWPLNVCELTRDVCETTGYLFDQSLKIANSKSFKSLKISLLRQKEDNLR